jgi:hypothetical protein
LYKTGKYIETYRSAKGTVNRLHIHPVGGPKFQNYGNVFSLVPDIEKSQGGIKLSNQLTA